MRVFFAMGPGDVVSDHNKNAHGTSGRGETSITFSGQAIRLLQARGDDALIVSSHPRRDSFVERRVKTRNVPKRLAGRSGPAFHLSQWLYARDLAAMAGRFGAELAIVDSGTSHWFMLEAFHARGIPVAVNLHNVRWPHGFEPSRKLGRAIRRMDSAFFRTRAVAAMGCSPECAVQVRADGADALRYFRWTGQFSASGFVPDQAPIQDGRFHIAFVGRVERNKGVFDIIDMALRLRSWPDLRICFEVCGDGGALDELRMAVAAAGVQDEVIVHGRLEREALLEVYARVHATIVPTRGTFCEGMPLVCAEAMLAGRPVVTSVLSNALPVIGPAVVQAQPENIESYVDAIVDIASSHARWQELHAATVACRAQFLDRSKSYAAAIDRLLMHVGGPDAALDYASLFD